MESAVKNAFGVKDKDEKKGGFLSFLGGGKDKDDKDDNDKGSLFSFGDDKKKDDDDKGGIFSKIFNKDDDDEGKQKKSGFEGLFSEQEGASGGNENEELPRFDEGSNPGAGLSDGGMHGNRDPCGSI